MERSRRTLALVALAVVGLLAACAAPAPQVTGSPQETVSAFYSWYTTVEGSPLGARAYRDSDYLSPEFIQEIDELADSFESGLGGFDPFICAQDAPAEITVLEAEGTPEMTRVTVQAWAPIYVDVKLIDWEWKIVAIHCTPPGEEAGLPPAEPEPPVFVEPTSEPAPPAEPTLEPTAPAEPTADPPTEDEPPATEDPPVAEIPADWTSFEDGEYGFRFWYPADWELQELPGYPPGSDVPEGEKARLYAVLVQPRGWDGIAAPLSIDVTEGTDEQFAALYRPPSASEEMVVNGYAGVRTTESFGTMFVTRYIVQNPDHHGMHLVFQDMLTGFPERLAGHEEIGAIIAQVVGTVEFEQQ